MLSGSALPARSLPLHEVAIWPRQEGVSCPCASAAGLRPLTSSRDCRRRSRCFPAHPGIAPSIPQAGPVASTTCGPARSTLLQTGVAQSASISLRSLAPAPVRALPAVEHLAWRRRRCAASPKYRQAPGVAGHRYPWTGFVRASSPRRASLPVAGSTAAHFLV